MRRPVLLEAAADVAAYAPLFEALAGSGERAGWLELDARETPPAGLEAAAVAGVLRAVRAGGGRVVSVKPVRGAPVLDDLLREHFLGCRLVLVRGGAGLPRLEADGDGGWRLLPPAGGGLALTTGELTAGLRRPAFVRRLAGA